MYTNKIRKDWNPQVLARCDKRY